MYTFNDDILSGRMLADWLREIRAISNPIEQVKRARKYYYVVTQYYSNFRRNHPSDLGPIKVQYESTLATLKALF
jgi:hypothetical protein